MPKIPKSLQGILWSKDVNNLNIDKDKNYIIHQILAYGTWKNLKWLFKIYKEEVIQKVFKKYPSKDYTKSSYNFVKKILLGIKESNIDKRLYDKTYPRIIRQ